MEVRVMLAGQVVEALLQGPLVQAKAPRQIEDLEVVHVPPTLHRNDNGPGRSGPSSLPPNVTRLGRERCPAPATRFGVGVHEGKTTGQALLDVVERRPVQVQVALA